MDVLSELMKEHPVLTDYIVGIDAASTENSTEPWVFAPIFRNARKNKGLIPYSPIINKNIQNIGFTYHVGEDFRHIISGLRHIDEVLTYFNYRTGDRLGHALALGIDIDKLAAHTQSVIIPIGEHLDNLLWMWKHIKTTSVVNSPDNLEYRIMNVAQKIYNDRIEGIDVYTLWRVYEAKFDELNHTFLQAIKREQKKNGEYECTLLDKFKKNDRKLDYNDLVLSHYCPCFYEMYNKPIFVDFSKEEINIYKELQKNLVKKVERYGVYVETNPSSNLAIGDIQSIFEHPIVRLNNRGVNLPNVEEACVLTSINSDDPIVFSTFVENEISYIYYSLLSAGCRREEALEWIDKIRQQGIDSSFIKNNYDIKKMKEDFEEILKIKL